MQKDQPIDDIKVNIFTDKATGMPIINASLKTDNVCELLVKIDNADGFSHITFFPLKDRNGSIYYRAKVNTYVPRRNRIIVKKEKP